MPRERLGATGAPPLMKFTLNEKLEFDDTPGSRRTAHTEGKMFGLTFWRTGTSSARTSRRSRSSVCCCTGKTLQNRYEGAFVPRASRSCRRVRCPPSGNRARSGRSDARLLHRQHLLESELEAASKPLFTPVAEAGTLSPERMAPAAAPGGWLHDVQELLEDPKPPAERLFARQRPLYDVREFDANGYRVASSSLNKQ